MKTQNATRPKPAAVPKRLVADVMLAKLARWLRLAGIRVESAPYIDDDKIIDYVRKKRATLLTEDEQLAGRSKKQQFSALLVKGNSIEKQLAYVANATGAKIGAAPALICPYCNTRLVKVVKAKAEGVPEHVAKTHRVFYMCNSCKRIYWRGTHWREISKKLRKAREIAAKL
ncbi:MAG: Mut7-C RNAse domain-containing protein, partial [Candidatus Micrarchaeia archaeon]